MKTAVIYHSQTGFTKRYATWIAEALEADLLALSSAKKQDLSNYEAIIFGSWAFAGGIRHLRWFKKNMNAWKEKKCIVFCVGASPFESLDVEEGLKRNFHEPMFNNVKVFYCPGGFNYEKMGTSSKIMMRLFLKMLAAKKEKTPKEQEMIGWIAHSYDISDKKYIVPIVEELRKGCDEKTHIDRG